MHLTVRKYRNVRGDARQLMDRIRRGFVPLISKIDGFVDYYCMRMDDGTILSVSVYRDAKGAEESVRVAASFVEQQLSEFFTEPAEVSSGDVFTHRHIEAKKAA